MSSAPHQQWWTAEELAASALPDVPTTKRGVNLLSERQNWRGNAEFARKRAGRGGGWEYNWRLLPTRAQMKLAANASVPVIADEPAREDVWAWFDGLPDKVKDMARQRLALIQQAELLTPELGRHAAIVHAAQDAKIGTRTLWSWFQLIEGVAEHDRLAALAPRHRLKPRAKPVKECEPAFFDVLKADFLRLEAPSFTSSYRRATAIARANGWPVLSEQSMRRRLEATVSKPVQVLKRKGAEALKRFYPAQVRDKTSLRALEAVNADFHKFDVFVSWPVAKGERPMIVRPQMVAFQDIYSGRVLAWRMDMTPNSTAVLLAAGDMIEDWGIPEHVLLDNGREFAAKSITGGAANRFRFKVREDDIPGLFTTLGCKIHWATPYSGQSKPIERAFRDMCDAIAKDPRLAGAYTGNRPEAKPENYGSHAVPLSDFLKVVAEGIEEHNHRQGRRSEVAFGRSFAEVFADSYATAPIRKATEAQRRLWLMGAEGMRAETSTGRVTFQGNRFWAPWMHEIAGKRVVIRFDLADFHAGVHVYSAENEYLGHAPCVLKAGFFDMEEARTIARARREWINAEKRAAEAHVKLNPAEVGRMLTRASQRAPAETADLEAKVVRPLFGKPEAQAPKVPMPAPISDEIAKKQAEIIEAFAAPKPTSIEETPSARFARALQLEARLTAGEDITSEQARWLHGYQTTSEYRVEQRLKAAGGEFNIG